MVSGAKTPNFAGVGRKRVVNVPTGKYISKLLQISTISLQYGVARSQKIFGEMDRYLEDFYIIGGETTDNNEVRENYQFAGKKVYSNEIVAVGVSTDLSINLIKTYDVGSKVRNVVRVTEKSAWDHIICKINNKPARKELLRILRWPDEYIDERIYRRIFFYPVGCPDSPTMDPHVMGAFWGDYIILEYPLRGSYIGFLEYSGETLRKSLQTVVDRLSMGEHYFGIAVACISSIETLGKSVYIIQERLNKVLKGVPFLLLYVAGEDVKYPNSPSLHMNYSFNMLTLSRSQHN